MPATIPSTFGSELDSHLRDLMAVWFPRTVDHERGGFLCDFDRRWRPAGAQRRLLEYQARQTLSAARAAQYAPEFAYLADIALHGLRYLRDVQWDHQHGGWFRFLDPNGSPLEDGRKHGHGTGYALSACAACYQATKDPAALELAQHAFGWLEQHAHDTDYGGYFAFYQQDGTPILSPDQVDLPDDPYRDPLGTPIGFKDLNTTSDILKGLAELYQIWPDPLLRERLEETLHIVRDRMVVAGFAHQFALPDWRPLPDPVRYGQVLRSAGIILTAAESLYGSPDPKTKKTAKSMVDMMLLFAWDPERGGFHTAGSALGPLELEDRTFFVPEKSWWVQADGLKVLLAVARLYPEDPIDYASYALRHWDYIRKYVIDAKFGGWYFRGIDVSPQAKRMPKTSMWKDASHETEAMLDSLKSLNAFCK